MNARDRRGKWTIAAAAIVAVGTIGSGSAPGQAQAQKGADGRVPIRAGGAGKASTQGNKAKGTAAAPAAAAKDEGPGEIRTVRVPVNPTDAVAIVNGKPITRQALADEAVMRKGEEVLDAMISRVLIEQAVAARKLSVTAQEIDAEVDKVVEAIGNGVDRDTWFRKLQQDRKISPSQYKNDVVYPGLALRKLSENQVQVTEKDMKDAYEAQFGAKLRCRIIMCMQERDAVQLWDELKKNPGGFAHVAANDRRSIDQATRANGGMLEQPMTRHAYPRTVSDGAFAQLVDGDPDDKDPAHKPKDGDISGPMQVTPETWILVKREGVIVAQPYDAKDKVARQKLRDMIFEAKLKEAMAEVFEKMVQEAAVENRLTGQIKVANETKEPDHRVDGQVKLMGNPDGDTAARPLPADSRRAKAVNDAVKPEDRAVREGFKKAADAPKAAAPK